MKQTEIIYIQDALCGWCYGFAPVVKQLQEKYQNKVKFTVLSGGMMAGERARPMSEIAVQSTQVCRQVENTTNAKFGEAFLKGILQDKRYIANSEPAALALTAFKFFLPTQSLAFSYEIQKAFFLDGKNINETSTFIKIATRFGLEENSFAQKMQSREVASATLREFGLVNRMGVRGFPSLLYNNYDSLVLLTNGYQSFAAIEPRLQRYIAQPMMAVR